MGWYGCYVVKHYKWVKGRQVVDRKACCDDIYTCDHKDENGSVVSTCRVLKSSMVGSVWYGAVETVKLAIGERKVWAGVCLTRGRAPDGTIFGYKDMDEEWGPGEGKCPVGILDLLTPTESENATAFRERCRENAAKKKTVKTLTLPPGITCTYRGGWVVSSSEYRELYRYSGVRYHRTSSKISAVSRFVEQYGTAAQKEAWTAVSKAA